MVFSYITDVNIGEAIGLLKAMNWVRDLHLWNMDFEVDSKTVVDSIYGKQTGVSDFSAIITHCIHLLCTDLMNSHVKFIRRQANEVAHSLAKAALSEASFRDYYHIPTCIESIIINEMH
jgi:ribonuclease HI